MVELENAEDEIADKKATNAMKNNGKRLATHNAEVFSKLRRFLECMLAIAEKWAKISSRQLEFFSTLLFK